jgi:hypothetical protein
MADPTEPARVARSEAELLDLAARIISPAQRSLAALREQPKRNARIMQIGPTAMRLLQQVLARGVAAELLRRGGWETRRTLVGDQLERGRLWERHPALPALHFTEASFRLLAWLRAEDVSEPKTTLEFGAPTSTADELLLYFAAAEVVKAHGNLRQPAFLCSPLCQLAFPSHLAGAEPLPDIDFGPLVSGDGAIVLEALQSELARRLLEIEQSKREIIVLENMIRLGAAQTQAFAGLFRAIEAKEPRRRDLAGFIAEAARDLLGKGPDRTCPDHRFWVEQLDMRAPLARRQAAFTASAAFLRTVGQLGRWLDEAGLVAHFDDDYASAQLLLSSWEYLRSAPPSRARPGLHADTRAQLPLSILDRAHFLAHQLESLHSLGLPS